MNFYRVSTAALLVFALFATQTSAQVLEEIVVTAQKREQQLSNVGISVTAFSGEQLQALGFTETSQIDEQVPGLMVTDYGGGTTTIFTIRGSSQRDFADLQEPPVAVYSDGAYNSFLAGVGFSFFDLDRIEVLRGPQGSLFGRNATGGVVHLISKRPTREYEGYVEATGGDYGQHRFEGALSGPLSDTISARLSMAYHDSNGFLDNLSVPGESASGVHNFSGRAQLLFEPNEDLSLLVLGHWGLDDVNGQLYILNPVVPDPVTGQFIDPPTLADFQAYCAGLGFPGFFSVTPPTVGSADCFGTPDDGDNRTAFGDQKGLFERDHYGITAELNWNYSDNITLTNIINWQDLKKRYLEDTSSSDNTFLPPPFVTDFDFFQDMDANQFSEEFRIAWQGENLQVTLGAYYLNIDSDMHTGAAPLFFGFDLDNTIALETDTWAAFVQAEWNFAPNFTFIGGFRWTEDDKDLEFRPTCPGAAAFGALVGIPGFLFATPADCAVLFQPGAAQGINLDLSRSEGDWSGVFELDWAPNDDWLVYAKFSRGHKAGGFNGGPASTYLVSQVEYSGEILDAYEGGFKATLFGGTTRVNTSVFYYDYKDFQTFNAAGIDLLVSNIDAENIGAEIEIVTNPWEGWEFLFGIGLQDAEQKDSNFGGFISDEPLPNAPDLMLNGLARYEWAGFRGGMMSAQVDFNYVDERSLNAAGHPALFDGDYTIVNAKLGWSSADDRWDAELWFKNILDTEYETTAFELSGFQGSSIDAYGAPFWFGGTVRHRFGN